MSYFSINMKKLVKYVVRIQKVETSKWFFKLWLSQNGSLNCGRMVQPMLKKWKTSSTPSVPSHVIDFFSWTRFKKVLIVNGCFIF